MVSQLIDAEVGGAPVKTAQNADPHNFSSAAPPCRSLKTAAARRGDTARRGRCRDSAGARIPAGRVEGTPACAALGAALGSRHHGASGARKAPALAMYLGSKVEDAASTTMAVRGGQGRPTDWCAAYALIFSVRATSTRKVTVLTLLPGCAHAGEALAQAGRISSRTLRPGLPVDDSAWVARGSVSSPTAAADRFNPRRCKLRLTR
jgi:hypothetical protein